MYTGIMKKQCQMCNTTKPVKQFHRSKSTKDGYFSYCASCKVIANKRSNNKRLTENREKFLDQRKSWHLKTTYGITLSDYKKILDSQNNVCAICNKNDNGRMLAVDHCHNSKVIRGLLCQRCNRGIGMFLDQPGLLIKAAKYLAN